MTFYATGPKSKVTAKQFEVLDLIVKGNPSTATEAHSLIDLDQLLERMKRETTKQAMQFIIRALVTNQMIEKAGQEKRRGRVRITYRPTALGEGIVTPRGSLPAFIEPEPGSLEAEFSGV